MDEWMINAYKVLFVKARNILKVLDVNGGKIWKRDLKSFNRLVLNSRGSGYAEMEDSSIWCGLFRGR